MTLEEQLDIELRNRIIHTLGEMVEGRPQWLTTGIFGHAHLVLMDLHYAKKINIETFKLLEKKIRELIPQAFEAWPGGCTGQLYFPVPGLGISPRMAITERKLYTTNKRSAYFAHAEIHRQLAAHVAKYLGEHWK